MTRQLIETKKGQIFWVEKHIIQELAWVALNDDVEAPLPFDFVDQQIYTNLFRHGFTSFVDFAPITQEKCIRHYLKTTIKYIELNQKLLEEGDGDRCFEEDLPNLETIVDMLASRLEELQGEIKENNLDENNPPLVRSSRTLRDDVKVIQFSPTFIFDLGVAKPFGKKWIGEIFGRDGEYCLPICTIYQLGHTEIYFDIFRRYESEFQSLYYCHFVLGDLFEREWDLLCRKKKSEYGTEKELEILGQLVQAFQKRIDEITQENESGTWKPNEKRYTIGDPHHMKITRFFSNHCACPDSLSEPTENSTETKNGNRD